MGQLNLKNLTFNLKKSYNFIFNLKKSYIQLENPYISTIKLTFLLEKILHETFERQIIYLKTGPE